jgi:hypothetical protein
VAPRVVSNAEPCSSAREKMPLPIGLHAPSLRRAWRPRNFHASWRLRECHKVDDLQELCLISPSELIRKHDVGYESLLQLLVFFNSRLGFSDRF